MKVRIGKTHYMTALWLPIALPVGARLNSCLELMMSEPKKFATSFRRIDISAYSKFDSEFSQACQD